jgi:hypothetical protein
MSHVFAAKTATAIQDTSGIGNLIPISAAFSVSLYILRALYGESQIPAESATVSAPPPRAVGALPAAPAACRARRRSASRLRARPPALYGRK